MQEARASNLHDCKVERASRHEREKSRHQKEAGSMLEKELVRNKVIVMHAEGQLTRRTPRYKQPRVQVMLAHHTQPAAVAVHTISCGAGASLPPSHACRHLPAHHPHSPPPPPPPPYPPPPPLHHPLPSRAAAAMDLLPCQPAPLGSAAAAVTSRAARSRRCRPLTRHLRAPRPAAAARDLPISCS